MLSRFQVRLLVVVAVFGIMASAYAAYPERPVRLLVGFAPGGGSDFASRVLAQRLTSALCQQFIVDHRPGAGGNLGHEIAARAIEYVRRGEIKLDTIVTHNLALSEYHDALDITRRRLEHAIKVSMTP